MPTARAPSISLTRSSPTITACSGRNLEPAQRDEKWFGRGLATTGMFSAYTM